MKKYFALCLCLLLIPAVALGAVRMPEQQGSVTDAANVLSQQTTADLSTYAQRVAEETELGLHVALVHFLDGAEVQSYANTLFDLWNLGSDDLLLLGAAGEDSFAAVMGSKAQKTLGAANAENLLYTSSEFSTLFRTQRYDEALAAYCTALNELIAKQTGESIRMDGLFGHSIPTVGEQVQQYTSGLWDEVMTAIQNSSSDYQVIHAEREREDNGVTAGGWIVLVILAFIILRQSKSGRRARQMGCGCSPLGWIFRLLGLNILVDIFRKH